VTGPARREEREASAASARDRSRAVIDAVWRIAASLTRNARERDLLLERAAACAAPAPADPRG
jgi:hypothetical protein